jgi:hypothetical protein
MGKYDALFEDEAAPVESAPKEPDKYAALFETEPDQPAEPIEQPKSTILSRDRERMARVGAPTNLGETFGLKQGTATEAIVGAPERAVRMVGGAVGTLADIPMTAISKVAGGLNNLTGGAGTKAAGAVGSMIPSGVKNAAGSLANWYNTRSPATKANLATAGDLTNLIGVGGVKPVASVAGNVAGSTLKASGQGLENLGKNTLSSGLKIKDTVARTAGKNTADGVKNIVDNIAKYDVQGSFTQIAKKSEAKISEAKKAADEIISNAVVNNPEKRVDIDKTILQFIEDAENGKIDALFGNEEKAAEIAMKLSNALDKRGIIGEVDLAQANKAKQLVGSKAFKKGAYGIAEDPVNMQVKELLDLRIRDAIRKEIPEIDVHNKAMHDLITVRNAANDAVKRVGNKDNIGLTDWMALLGAAPVAASMGLPPQMLPMMPIVGGTLMAKKALSSGRGGSSLLNLGKKLSESGESLKSMSTSNTGKKAPFIDLKSQRGSVGAYHGSPHKFDQFGPLDEVVGTGEGVQAFGHGLYFTSEKDIANHYAKDLSARAKVIPYDYSKISDNQRKAIETIKSIGSKSDAVKLAKAKKNPLLSTIETIDEDKIFGPKGNTYQVTLHKGKTPDQYDYIKWDEPISEKIVDKLRDRLSGGMDHKQEEIVDFLDAYQGKNRLTDNGEDIYKEISRIMGSDKAASDILLYGGVDGIDYPAGSLSMFGGGGFTKNQRNYVVFDPKAVTIESVNGSPINKTGFSAPATMAGAGALAGLGLTGKAIYDNKKKAGKK